jgi:hypothetical protein
LGAILTVGLAFAVNPMVASAADTSIAQATPATPAAPTASANPTAVQFSDVPANHWAYPALQQLQADGLVQGYPDGYFKGNRPLTRYEMAAITARVVKRLEAALADAQTAQKVNAADIAAVRRLLDEYGDQLKAVQKDVATLKDQVALNTATLDRQQFHLYYFLRAPGAYRDRVAAYTAAGAPLPANAAVVGPDNGVGPQQLTTGETAHGTGYQTLRMVFSGNVDKKTSYAIRLEDRYYLDNTVGNGGARGDSTSSVTPGSGSFPNNSLLRINYAALTYKDPSGLYARLGRFVEGGGDIGLAFADYFNGAELGYASGRLSGFAGYSFNKAANSNAAPYTGLSSQSLFGRLATTVGKSGSLGVNYITDLAFYGGGPTVFNPATLRYQQVATALTVGSVDAGYAFSPFFGLKAEFAHRFGNNPLGGGNWNGPNAFWGQGTLGSSGKTGANYADFGYITAGANSTSVHTEIEGTPDYQQFFINNPNGYKIGYFGIHHFFSDKAQIGLIYQGYGLNGNNVIPIDSYAFGTGAGRVVTPCLGCYIRRDDGQALFLETRLSF